MIDGARIHNLDVVCGQRHYLLENSEGGRSSGIKERHLQDGV